MNRTRKLIIFGIAAGLIVIAGGSASARLTKWVIGGTNSPWARWAESMRAVDCISRPGAIQPKEFRPDENMVQFFFSGEKGVDWSPRSYLYAHFYRPHMPLVWHSTTGYYGEAYRQVDGSWSCDRDNSWNWPLHPRYRKIGHFYTIDFGVPVPANKFVFGPPQTDVLCPDWNIPFRDTYMRGYKVSAAKEWPEWLTEEPRGTLYPPGTEWYQYRHFSDLVVQNQENTQSPVVIEFPTQYLRLFRIQNTVEAPYSQAEIEVYGQGFVSEAIYTSKIIDLGEKANLGKICWKDSYWRRTEQGELEALPISERKVQVSVQTRVGKDDTPLVFHEYTDTGDLRVVSEEEWKKLKRHEPPKPIVPGLRGPVTDDKENWSSWSLPYARSGQQITSPGPRRYLQFRITIETEDFRQMARIDSVWFETSSPPLADKLVGEIALASDPSPAEAVAVVTAGMPTRFTYDVRANFTSPRQAGFDSLVVYLPSKAEFEELQMGNRDTLITVASRASLVEPGVYQDLLGRGNIYVDTSSPDKMTVFFPSQPVAYGSWDRLRLVFSTSVLVYGTRFPGMAWRTGTEELSQPIEPGDANEQVATDQLKVLVREESVGSVLEDVQITPQCITPNGDGANEQAIFSYKLLQVTDDVEVDLSIYDLSGAKVKTIYKGKQAKGIYQNGDAKFWKADDEEGKLVAPGLYIWQLSVESDKGVSYRKGTIAVAY